tara:strand:- start:4038 stop:4202 length:165 start_codon:yes stop_codon:yes gene_type:complete
MTVLKTNSANDLRIQAFDNGSFTVNYLMGDTWVPIADANSRAAANNLFKSFGGK